MKTNFGPGDLLLTTYNIIGIDTIHLGRSTSPRIFDIFPNEFLLIAEVGQTSTPSGRSYVQYFSKRGLLWSTESQLLVYTERAA